MKICLSSSMLYFLIALRSNGKTLAVPGVRRSQTKVPGGPDIVHADLASRTIDKLCPLFANFLYDIFSPGYPTFSDVSCVDVFCNKFIVKRKLSSHLACQKPVGEANVLIIPLLKITSLQNQDGNYFDLLLVVVS